MQGVQGVGRVGVWQWAWRGGIHMNGFAWVQGVECRGMEGWAWRGAPPALKPAPGLALPTCIVVFWLWPTTSCSCALAQVWWAPHQHGQVGVPGGHRPWVGRVFWPRC